MDEYDYSYGEDSYAAEEEYTEAAFDDYGFYEEDTV